VPRRVFFGATARDAAEAGFDDAFIYEQLSVDPAQREIPFTAMMREEALACFREWRAKLDRVEY
jgi:guanine deaminase